MEKSEVLDTSILIAGATGLTTVFNAIEYPPASKNCDVIFPTINDFKLSIELSVKLRKTGTPVGAIDTIISSMCINRGLKIVTKDTDFKAIKAIEPSLNVALKQ